MISLWSISRKLLNEGEHVVLSTRTHVKALLLPAVVLIIVAGLAGYLSSLPSGDNAAIWRWVIWVIAAIADRLVLRGAVPELAADDVHLHQPSADHPHRASSPGEDTTSR